MPGCDGACLAMPGCHIWTQCFMPGCDDACFVMPGCNLSMPRCSVALFCVCLTFLQCHTPETLWDGIQVANMDRQHPSATLQIHGRRRGSHVRVVEDSCRLLRPESPSRPHQVLFPMEQTSALRELQELQWGLTFSQ
eukprot:939059-Pelagomonas_calceolata.AAC.1